MTRLCAPTISALVLGSLLAASSATAQPAETSPANQLSPAEKAAGWKLLFDGKNTSAWRAYKGKEFPTNGWSIDDGCIKTKADAKGAPDIITTDQYSDFELSVEWKVAPKGNSGIIYRLIEKHDASWQTGPECQILDNAGNNVKSDDPHAAGALYDLYPPSAAAVCKPAGEFNVARVVVQGGRVEHWLNGVKVVAARMDNDEWKQKIAASKFKAYEGFGMQPKGHVGLQHHGGDVWFRNIKIRDLSAPMPGEKQLFNGKDLTGWKPVLPDNAKPENTWSVKDGVLVCLGQPIGYIRTEEKFTNYVLKVEWRFNPITKKAGNSGVLLRTQEPDKVWPKSVEAQLESGNAGDFWNIEEFQMKTDPARLKGRNTKHTHAAERPLGEWNEYEIVVDHGRITLKVNGDVLNEARDVAEVPGTICLQSEGAEIHFRSVRLAPIQ